MILIPLNVCCLVTVTYLDNPIVKRKSRYLIIPLSIFFIIEILGLAGDNPNQYVVLGIAAGTALVLLILEMIGLNENYTSIILELISVIGAIAWISIFSNIIIDLITFLSFYFNINKVILSSLLLSAGNSIGDFFGNGALSKAGEEIMGAIASYSGQIFNNFIGFSITVFLCT